MQTLKLAQTTWIDVKQPNADAIVKLNRKYKLHPLVVEEFSTPTMRPKATEYSNCLYLAVHIPLFDTDSRTTYPGELDIIICDGTLITSHDQDIYQLTDFFQELKTSKRKREKYSDSSPAKLLYYILEMLLESCFPKLDHISKKLYHVEEEIFAGHEKEMVIELSVVKRDILNFRRTMKPQRTVFESLASKDFTLVEASLRPYFQDLIGTNIRIWNTLESSKETVESLEDTNNSLLSNKLDLTMKVLTIFSAIMLPMTVYSNVLAMSADIPFGKHPFGFWIHLGVMLMISGFTMSVFKIKNWL